jgi:hypothetical protein
MKRFELIRENSVAAYFLMKHAMMGFSKFENDGFEIRKSFVEFGKAFFDALDKNIELIPDDEVAKIEMLRKTSLENLYDMNYEMNDDITGAKLEYDLLEWNYKKMQEKEDRHEEESKQLESHNKE